jgi:hypothetical protein
VPSTARSADRGWDTAEPDSTGPLDGVASGTAPTTGAPSAGEQHPGEPTRDPFDSADTTGSGPPWPETAAPASGAPVRPAQASPFDVSVPQPAHSTVAPGRRDLAARASPQSLSVSAVPADQIETTIDALRAAISANPAQLDLHRKLGFLLARQGRTAEAAAEFRLARGEDDGS